MATAADVAAHRAAQQDIVTLATADLNRWWLQVSGWAPDALTVAMEQYVADLVVAYGDMASVIAADWYDELRAEAQAPGRFRASMAAPAPAEQASAVARWAAGPLYAEQADPAQVLRLLAGGVQRLVLQPARATIATSAGRDPAGVRWARVPGRANACAFCRLTASRGAVYHSQAKAGGSLMTRYHTKCGCVATPIWPGQSEPYDVDALLQEYNAARAKAGGDPRAIAAQMREDLGIN
ncbi:VG15 protein [Rhizomonospora bruguierae]|uniref:VG15 protein n=1 Tax=Rhizomonospora bruguierae TaxID=1581705 RepID=UPI001BCD8B49|nr:hypothetical protein [Micromonospora sp. NBRC 107566]